VGLKARVKIKDRVRYIDPVRPRASISVKGITCVLPRSRIRVSFWVRVRLI
jgi:hypothetical protein